MDAVEWTIKRNHINLTFLETRVAGKVAARILEDITPAPASRYSRDQKARHLQPTRPDTQDPGSIWTG
jgi:hypothetical protein